MTSTPSLFAGRLRNVPVVGVVNAAGLVVYDVHIVGTPATSGPSGA